MTQHTNWHELDQKHHFNLYKRFPVTLDYGKGTRVWDTEGNEYLDALAGIAVNSLGHSHPKFVAALHDQVSKLIHISNFYTSVPQVQLSEKLTSLTGLDRVFFTNSGGEAIEGAIKLARKYGHENGKNGNIVSLEGCFHGRTLGGIATGKGKYQEGFHPMPSGFKQVAFNNIEALTAEVDDNTVAVILEPIQGEGGIRPLDKTYLKQVRELCDKHGTPLILDEIQCGVGRTGHMFAYEYFGIKPDILALAKALGGGVPVGALLAKEHIAKTLVPGNHGTTYGGNPLATRAGLEALKIIEDEGLIQQAADNGQWMLDQLKSWASGEDAVKEIRGLGLMIGVELNFDAQQTIREMFNRGVLANAASGTVIRLVPPLNISRDDLETVFETVKISVEQAKQHES